MSEVLHPNVGATRRRGPAIWPNLDHPLLVAMIALAALGLVMVTSASISIADDRLGDPLYYMERQAAFLVFGGLLAVLVFQVPMDIWRRTGPLLIGLAYGLLLVVLIPGVGREVNGAVRWIPLGFINLQVSEPAKLLLILYIAGYVVRRADNVRETMTGFLIPIGTLLGASALLLMEPDFGASVVLVATGLGMLFLAGVPLWRFLFLGAIIGAAAAALIVGSPYRWGRLTAFLNPWADPFDTGFQLTQSLIAIGRGEIFGVGLGASVQKLFYLPEAHTDFVLAVLAEELGLIGVLVVLALYGFIVIRALQTAAGSLRSGRPFAGYLAYGIAIWLALQVFVNMGVNMGLLPTKGLTLPLLSYGGSSLFVSLCAFALLLRVDYELRVASVAARPTERGDE